MKESTREHVVDGNIWLRGLNMILFLIAYNIAEVIIVFLAFFQFITVLFTGRVNEHVLQFGKNLSVYAFEIFEFLTFNTDVRPFPFLPWPDEAPGGEDWLDDEIGEDETSETEAAADVAAEGVDDAEFTSAVDTDKSDPDKPAGN
jgi:hypothetical protein